MRWGGGEPVIPEPHNHRALQHQLHMWEVPEASLHLFLGPAHPQEGVPQACLQEGCRSPAVAEVIAATEVLPRPSPKRMARLPLPIPRARAPLWPLSLHHTTADGGPPTTTTSPTRRTQLSRERRQMT